MVPRLSMDDSASLIDGLSSAGSLGKLYETMLLTPDFIRELEVLRRRLDTRARSGMRGEKVSARRGASVEFLEHRAYAPMDDLRRIDWAAYARTGEPVLKVFRAEEDVVVRILCDSSASMACGSSPKLPVAQRLSAAIGYMALARSERAQLCLVQDGLVPGGPPSRGRAGLGGFLRSIESAEAAGKTDLARAITETVKRAPRPGLLVVCSDFFDAGAVLTAASRAIMAGHELVLLQLVSPEDTEPQLDGDLTLVDVETGAAVEVTVDRAALEAYALRFAGLCEELRGFARRHHATYVRARTDEALEPVVRRVVARSVD